MDVNESKATQQKEPKLAFNMNNCIYRTTNLYSLQKHHVARGHYVLEYNLDQESSNSGLEGRCPATSGCVLDSTHLNHKAELPPQCCQVLHSAANDLII